jgi:uncharacterized protein
MNAYLPAIRRSSMKLLSCCALALLLIGATRAAPAAADGRPTTDSVKQLLEALGSKSMLSTMEGQLDSMMKRSVEQALNGKTLTPQQQAVMDDMRHRVIDLISSQMTWETVEPTFISVYQDNFTQKEVDGMLVFYRSDVGKSVVKKLPQAMLTSMQVMQTKMASLAPQIQDLQRQALRQLQASEQAPAPQQAPSPLAAPAPQPSTPPKNP